MRTSSYPALGSNSSGWQSRSCGRAALAEAGRVNEVWDSVGLAYGDWAAPAGPWVMVTTASRRGDAPDGSVEAELLQAIDQERNRIAAMPAWTRTTLTSRRTIPARTWPSA